MSNQNSPWASLNQALHHFQSSAPTNTNNSAAVNLYAAAAAAIAYNQLLTAANTQPSEKCPPQSYSLEAQRHSKGPAPHVTSAFSIYTPPGKWQPTRPPVPKPGEHSAPAEKEETEGARDGFKEDRVQSSATQSLSSQQFQSNGGTPKTGTKRDRSSSQPEATKAGGDANGSGSNTNSNQSTTVSGQASPNLANRHLEDNKTPPSQNANLKQKHTGTTVAADKVRVCDAEEQSGELSDNESNDDLPEQNKLAVQRLPHPKATVPEWKDVEWKDNDDLSGSSLIDDDVHRISKKPRLVWTPELHARFMHAVQHLGVNHAVPKTILKLMNVEGMTRENVASHLQKYRLYLKRLAGVSANAPIPSDMLNSVQEQAMKQHQAKQAQQAAQQAQAAAAQQAAAQSLLNAYGPPPPLNLVGMPMAYELRGYNFMQPGVTTPSVGPLMQGNAPHISSRSYNHAPPQAAYPGPTGAPQYGIYGPPPSGMAFGVPPMNPQYPWGAGYPVMYNQIPPNSYGMAPPYGLAQQAYASQQLPAVYYGVNGPPGVSAAQWTAAEERSQVHGFMPYHPPSSQHTQ